MADTKISALPASTTPLAGTEVLPIVQGGVTKQASVANLTAGRAISATELTLTTGNLVIGTSGKGIDFSATPGTGTSELLSDYEEGTFNAQITDGTNNATMSAITCRYTKIGRQVFVHGNVSTSSVAGLSGPIFLGGLPFVASGFSAGVVGQASGLNISAGYQVVLAVGNGQTRLELSLWDVATGTTLMTAAEWSDDGNIILGLTYTV